MKRIATLAALLTAVTAATFSTTSHADGILDGLADKITLDGLKEAADRMKGAKDGADYFRAIVGGFSAADNKTKVVTIEFQVTDHEDRSPCKQAREKAPAVAVGECTHWYGSGCRPEGTPYQIQRTALRSPKNHVQCIYRAQARKH